MKEGKILVISDRHRPGHVFAWEDGLVEFNEKGEAWVSPESAAMFATVPLYHVPELEGGETPTEQPEPEPESVAPEPEADPDPEPEPEPVSEPEPAEEKPAPKNWARATKAELIDELVARGVIDQETAESKLKGELMALLG